jgi:ATP-binding cassette, subfamily F, member 2
MASAWHKKKEKIALSKLEKELEESANNFSEDLVKKDVREAAMGKGDDELFEKKLSKDEKKARAKAQREAKKKAKMEAQGLSNLDDDGEKDQIVDDQVTLEAQMSKNAGEDGIDYEQADKLASEGTICTFSTSRKGVDARSRDINVQNFTLQHKGAVMLDETEIVLNHGNRYGLIGRNGCGKVSLLRIYQV